MMGCVPFPAFWNRIFCVAVCAAWIFFLAVMSRILRPIFFRNQEEADCIIVLGAQVRGTKITNSLKRRLDAALEYLDRYPLAKVIVSGGQGKGEDISEARAMAQYLEENGVEKERIFLEDRSTSTRENLRFSAEFTDIRQKKNGIVTNDFHIYRASLIARQEGYEKICLIPASSNPVFQINYLVREFFAVTALMLRKR